MNKADFAAGTGTSFLREMEATISRFCLRALGEIAKQKNWIRSGNFPHDMKFVAEVIVAFKERKSPIAKRILKAAHGVLFSDYARRLLACNPTSSCHFLTTYASLPARYRTSDWTEMLRALTTMFPIPQGDIPPYRVEELTFAGEKVFGRKQGKIDLEEFIFSTPWLTRDQVYCFTHRVFYITDYGFHPFDPPVRHLRQFIEDKCFDWYARKDLDVLLELIICYQALKQHDLQRLRFFKVLALRLFRKNAGMVSVFERNGEANFRKFYHQALLFMMLLGMDTRASFSMRGRDFWETYRDLSVRRRFVRRLCRLHVIDTYRGFVALAEQRDTAYYKCLLERYASTLKITEVLGSKMRTARDIRQQA
jgi:hypothetical protein